MSGQLNGSGFVHRNMSAVRTEYALVGREEGVNHRGIGLGAARQKFHLSAGAVTGLSDFFFSSFANAVASVAGIWLSVFFRQTF